MKVIISRKGFDSKNGGCPSPIFPNGAIASLPIPSRRAPTRFSDLTLAGRNAGGIVEGLTRGRLPGGTTAHLDPDLDARSLPRKPGWLPAFGQTEGQLTHLMNQGVGEGDLFLFFGWFKEVVQLPDGSCRPTAGAPNRHAIFGWLQVGRVIHIGSRGTEAVAASPWLHAHPHVSGTWGEKNAVFVASDRLDIPGLPKLGSLPGGGMFAKISASRTLTKAGQPRRSLWSLPAWFAPEHGQAKLSLHENARCWLPDATDATSVLLDSAKIGQEFVLTCRDGAPLSSWLGAVFA